MAVSITTAMLEVVYFLEKKNTAFNICYITIDLENLFFSSFDSDVNQKQQMYCCHNKVSLRSGPKGQWGKNISQKGQLKHMPLFVHFIYREKQRSSLRFRYTQTPGQWQLSLVQQPVTKMNKKLENGIRRLRKRYVGGMKVMIICLSFFFFCLVNDLQKRKSKTNWPG